MTIFEKLKSGEPVDETSEAYRPVLSERQRAHRALYLLNQAEPGTRDYDKAWMRLFDGRIPKGIAFETPCRIDFPNQITWGKDIVVGHSFTALSIGGIVVGDGVRIDPQVTIVTETRDQKTHHVIRGQTVTLGEGAWIGARALISPGVTIGARAVVAPGAVVRDDVAADTVVAGNPAQVVQRG